MIEANAGKLHKITTVRYEEGTKIPLILFSQSS
jgi:hypothetical protein